MTVNGGVCTRPGRTMTAGDNVAVEIPPPPTTDLEPEDIPLDILYEDDDLVVVNKPSGLVVHPGAGQLHRHAGQRHPAPLQGFHCGPGGDSTRPGIVHRLDKDTSGVLVVAKTPAAFLSLSDQAREHSFDRRYLALVRGEFKERQGPRSPPSIGRSMADPARMAVTGVGGRDAVTHFEVLERFGVASLLSVQLETGRTHQIRVHLRFAGHPVLGDPVYGVTDYAEWKLSDRREVRAPSPPRPGAPRRAARICPPRHRRDRHVHRPRPPGFPTGAWTPCGSNKSCVAVGSRSRATVVLNPALRHLRLPGRAGARPHRAPKACLSSFGWGSAG